MPARKRAFNSGVSGIAKKKADRKGAFLGGEVESLLPSLPSFLSRPSTIIA